MWKIIALPVIKKLITVLTVRKTLSNLPLVQKLLSELAIILVLAIMAVIMTLAVIFIGFHALYQALIVWGMQPFVAMTVISAMMCLIVVVLVTVIINHLRKAQDLSHQLLEGEEPPSLPSLNVRGIGKSFMSGLRNPRSKKENE